MNNFVDRDARQLGNLRHSDWVKHWRPEVQINATCDPVEKCNPVYYVVT